MDLSMEGVCMSQDEPQALWFLMANMLLGVQSHETLSQKLIRGRSGWWSTGYRASGCDERDGKQE